jgi:hypothetical protein
MGDLLGVVDARWPWATNAQVYNNVVQLMTLITQSVEPTAGGQRARRLRDNHVPSADDVVRREGR